MDFGMAEVTLSLHGGPVGDPLQIYADRVSGHYGGYQAAETERPSGLPFLVFSETGWKVPGRTQQVSQYATLSFLQPLL